MFWQAALFGHKGLERMSGLVTNVHKLHLFQQGWLPDPSGTRLKIRESEKHWKAHMESTKSAAFSYEKHRKTTCKEL